MIKQGLLDKYGKANEQTPAAWKEGYKEINGLVVNIQVHTGKYKNFTENLLVSIIITDNDV